MARRRETGEEIRPARSVLVTPDAYDPIALAAQISTLTPQKKRTAEAESPVAALIVTPPVGDSDPNVRLTQAAERVGADGVHIETRLDSLRTALSARTGDRQIGVGNLKSRHEAMRCGELGPDYMFFGLLSQGTAQRAHPKTLSLGAWWAEVFEIPAVVLAGASDIGLEEAAKTGAEFVAARHAPWTDTGGLTTFVARAARIFAETAVRRKTTHPV